MHQAARHNRILDKLSHRGSCTVAELMAALGVSDETIRRDIKALARKGLVERVHGGVMLPPPVQQAGFQKRMSLNARAKQAIAHLAAEQIRNGDSLMLDNGSTTLYVAQALARHTDLFVVTNCVEIARTLGTDQSGNRVHLAGGQYFGDESATFGRSAIDFVQRFSARHAIVSAGAIDADFGVMDFHLAEAEFAQAIVANAAHVMVVADQSKFGNQAPAKVCPFDRVATLTTDLPPPPAIRRRLEQTEVRLITADEHPAESA